MAVEQRSKLGNDREVSKFDRETRPLPPLRSDPRYATEREQLLYRPVEKVDLELWYTGP